MKAIILSAGNGSRLLPITEHLPKCLVPVGGRPILEQQLHALGGAGIAEAIVVGGYRHGQIAEFLAGDMPLATRMVVNPFWSVANSIGSVWVVRDELHAPFCLLNGDTLFDTTVLADAIRRATDGVSLLVEAVGPIALDDMRVGVAEGHVAAVSKTLPAERTSHRSLGVVLSPGRDLAYAAALERVITAEDGHQAYHHAVIAELARTVGVAAIVNRSGSWQEIDRPEDIAGWASHDTITDDAA